MSFICELSGEPLAISSGQEVVVTPSGHVCYKRLLLSRLAENGSLDPFLLPNQRQPLTEELLIPLRQYSSNAAISSNDKTRPMIIPPRLVNTTGTVTGFSSLLVAIQDEYDAIIHELFDARLALQTTRRELSQALYQQDAACRVVARLVQERDTARAAIVSGNHENTGHDHNNPSLLSTVITDTTTSTNNRKRTAAETSSITTSTTTMMNTTTADTIPTEDSDVGTNKKLKIALPQPPPPPPAATTKLPERDLQALLDTWQLQHGGRKVQQKVRATQAPDSTMTIARDWVWDMMPMAGAGGTATATAPMRPAMAAWCPWITTAASNSSSSSIIMTMTTSTNNDSSLVLQDWSSRSMTTVALPGLAATAIDVQTNKTENHNNNNNAVWVAIGLQQKDANLMVVHATMEPDQSSSSSSSWKTTTTTTITMQQADGDNNDNDNDNDHMVVHLAWHPQGQYLVIAHKNGILSLCRVEQQQQQQDDPSSPPPPALDLINVAVLRDPDHDHIVYTTGALHPDGLIYLAGTATGSLVVWDLKEVTGVHWPVPKEVMGVEVVAEATNTTAVTAITCSNNGYHVAVTYANDKLCLWDLRKQMVLHVLDMNSSGGSPRWLLSFDPSGKYLAYCGSVDDTPGDTQDQQTTATSLQNQIQLVTVKDWNNPHARAPLSFSEPLSTSAAATTTTTTMSVTSMTWMEDGIMLVVRAQDSSTAVNSVQWLCCHSAK